MRATYPSIWMPKVKQSIKAIILHHYIFLEIHFSSKLAFKLSLRLLPPNTLKLNIFFKFQDEQCLSIKCKLGLKEFLIITENQLSTVKTNEYFTSCSSVIVMPIVTSRYVSTLELLKALQDILSISVASVQGMFDILHSVHTFPFLVLCPLYKFHPRKSHLNVFTRNCKLVLCS